MNIGLQHNGKMYVTTAQAAARTSYAVEYVERLCNRRHRRGAETNPRLKLLDVVKEGNRHFITVESLEAYRDFDPETEKL